MNSNADTANEPSNTVTTMKNNNPQTPKGIASGDSLSVKPPIGASAVAEFLSRFLSGLTTAEEERLLRSAIETKAAHGTALTEDERAAFAILRLSFPEEDTTTLLTEDLSDEYETLIANRQTIQSSLNFNNSGLIHHRSLPLHSRLFRIAASFTAIAAVFALAFLIIIKDKPAHPTEKESQELISLSSVEHEVGETLDSPPEDSPSALDSPPALPAREGAVTLVGSNPSSSLMHSAPSLAGMSGGESLGGGPVSSGGESESASHPIDDPDGAAILAAEQQRIIEAEAAAMARAIAVQQENTLASLKATSPS